MFAQRQRWRPAKAFLVDDSGRMLREFTLDSACLVTYDQAVQAGILDAVEKPIKVAKYHGQTVRGDALAGVVPPHGPGPAEGGGGASGEARPDSDKNQDTGERSLRGGRGPAGGGGRE